MSSAFLSTCDACSVLERNVYTLERCADMDDADQLDSLSVQLHGQACGPEQFENKHCYVTQNLMGVVVNDVIIK